MLIYYLFFMVVYNFLNYKISINVLLKLENKRMILNIKINYK